MNASKRELIHAAIDNLDEEQLEELYRLIEGLSSTRPRLKKRSLMSKLKTIQIEAPEDFAENLDLYLSGEKCAD